MANESWECSRVKKKRNNLFGKDLGEKKELTETFYISNIKFFYDIFLLSRLLNFSTRYFGTGELTFRSQSRTTEIQWHKPAHRME